MNQGFEISPNCIGTVVKCTREEEINIIYNIWGKIGRMKYRGCGDIYIRTMGPMGFRIHKVGHNNGLPFYLGKSGIRVYSFKEFVDNLDLFF